MTWYDLEWLFHVKIRFRTAFLDSERLTFKNLIIALKVTEAYRIRLSAAEM